MLEATPLHPQWLLRFGRSSKMLLTQASGRTLDIGCADRWPEAHLPAGCEYVSLDYPLTGRDLYDAKPDVYADAAALPFPSKSCDTVLLFEVLEHLERPEQALAEITRVLRDGGKAIITMPFLYPMHDEPYDYQRYTRYGLARGMTAAGLRIESIQPSLGAAKTAGLCMNLALAGLLVQAVEQRRIAVLTAPLVLIVVLLVNLVTPIVDWAFPNWPAMTAGFHVVAVRE